MSIFAPVQDYQTWRGSTFVLLPIGTLICVTGILIPLMRTDTIESDTLAATEKVTNVASVQSEMGGSSPMARMLEERARLTTMHDSGLDKEAKM